MKFILYHTYYIRPPTTLYCRRTNEKYRLSDTPTVSSEMQTAAGETHYSYKGMDRVLTEEYIVEGNKDNYLEAARG